MSQAFFDRLSARARAIDSLLCVGLDPRVPADLNEDDVTAYIVSQNKALIDATKHVAAAYKPNIAFYEAYGDSGMLALRSTLGLIPDDIPVVLDAKRADIGATSEAYAKASFEHWGVDSITASPYMGRDAVEPFATYDGKGVFVLCKTSNPGSADLQTCELSTGGSGEAEMVYQRIARLVAGWGANYGLVVAGNDSTALATIRRDHPSIWFLSPGIGAQGGTIAEAVSAGLSDDGLGILLVVARSISNAKDPRAEAQRLVEEFRLARDNVLKARKSLGAKIDKEEAFKEDVLRGLVKTGCFKTGEFTLKSGLKSPFYVDLRRVMSDAALLRQVGKAYGSLINEYSSLRGIKFDRIAGIPVAALPLATAMSLETGIPMIFPRLQQKEHGTGNLIEGEYKAGENVLLLDDLITTGKSKVEALEILRKAGLKVEHLVVLLERGVQGRKDMEAEGVTLHAFAHINDFLPLCQRMGILDEAERRRLETFAASAGA